MHRTINLTIPPATTDGLARILGELPGVLNLAVHRGASLKPPGDLLVVQSLNIAAGEVLRHAREAAGESLSVSTAEATSLTDPAAQARIDADKDEALWEEMESRLLQEGSATSNFLALTAFGGVVAIAGLASDPVQQAVALVSASVIAPGFEPLAKAPLGIVLRRWDLVGKGLLSAVVGYTTLILSAGLGLSALLALGAVTPEQFVDNPQVQKLGHTTTLDLFISAGGALAGMVMIASFRHDVIAGALMALILIPAGAMVGGALALGRTDLAAGGLQRVGVDILLVAGAGILVFSTKQLTVHRRRSLRRR